MIRFPLARLTLLLTTALTLPGAARDAKLDPLLHAVEQRYNRAQTLSLVFTETYFSGRRARPTESGLLELRKPGRMYWKYTNPEGKWFLSDAKYFYLFSPTTQRVEKSPLRDTEDLRAPLAFLLGRLNFYKEFRGFESHVEGDDVWITADANSPNLPYSKVEFLVTKDARIRRLRVSTDDYSTLDYTFENEKTNLSLDPSHFVFRLPAGAELIEMSR